MTKLPRISIVIPVYNVEEYISECMRSVMRQTYKGEIECILVDDCGNDQSVAVAKDMIADYKGSIDFRIVRHERNRGLSAARNTGTDVATGEYVIYLDSDDYISNNCLEVLSQPLLEREYDIVVGDLEMFGEPKDIVFLTEPTGATIGNGEIFRKWYVSRRLYMMAWNKLVKASLFKEHDLSFLEGQLHEDELWTYKIASCVQSLYVQHIPTYYYRIRNNSIMGDWEKNSPKMLKSCYQTLDYVLDHPAVVKKADYQKCVVYYIRSWQRHTYKAEYRDEYMQLRERFAFHPIQDCLKGQLSPLDVVRYMKHQIHLFMPPLMAYSYLTRRK